MPAVQDDLAELAAAYGVATSYRDSAERTVAVDADVVVDVLAALDVDASSPEAVREALAARRARGGLPPTIVAPTDLELPGPGELTLEDGTVRSVSALDAAAGPARGLPPAALRGRRGHGARAAAAAPRGPAHVGLDGAGVLPALGGVVGLRRPGRPARRARGGLRPGRGRGADQPAARAAPRPDRRVVPVLALVAPVPAPGVAARAGDAGLPRRARARPARRRPARAGAGRRGRARGDVRATTA